MFAHLRDQLQVYIDKLVTVHRGSRAKKQVKFNHDDDKENKQNAILGKRSESFEDFFNFDEPVIKEKKSYA